MLPPLSGTCRRQQCSQRMLAVDKFFRPRSLYDFISEIRRECVCGQGGTQWKRKCSHTAAIWPSLRDHNTITVPKYRGVHTIYSVYCAGKAVLCCALYLELCIRDSKIYWDSLHLRGQSEDRTTLYGLVHGIAIGYILFFPLWNKDFINTISIRIRIESDALLSLQPTTSITLCCRRRKSIVRG